MLYCINVACGLTNVGVEMKHSLASARVIVMDIITTNHPDTATPPAVSGAWGYYCTDILIRFVFATLDAQQWDP
jgi:hypothetical protein